LYNFGKKKKNLKKYSVTSRHQKGFTKTPRSTLQ